MKEEGRDDHNRITRGKEGKTIHIYMKDSQLMVPEKTDL